MHFYDESIIMDGCAVDPLIGHSLVFEYLAYGDLQTLLLSSFSRSAPGDSSIDYQNLIENKKHYKIQEVRHSYS